MPDVYPVYFYDYSYTQDLQVVYDCLGIFRIVALASLNKLSLVQKPQFKCKMELVIY